MNHIIVICKNCDYLYFDLIGGYENYLYKTIEILSLKYKIDINSGLFVCGDFDEFKRIFRNCSFYTKRFNQFVNIVKLQTREEYQKYYELKTKLEKVLTNYPNLILLCGQKDYTEVIKKIYRIKNIKYNKIKTTL